MNEDDLQKLLDQIRAGQTGAGATMGQPGMQNMALTPPPGGAPGPRSLGAPNMSMAMPPPQNRALAPPSREQLIRQQNLTGPGTMPAGQQPIAFSGGGGGGQQLVPFNADGGDEIDPPMWQGEGPPPTQVPPGELMDTEQAPDNISVFNPAFEGYITGLPGYYESIGFDPSTGQIPQLEYYPGQTVADVTQATQDALGGITDWVGGQGADAVNTIMAHGANKLHGTNAAFDIISQLTGATPQQVAASQIGSRDVAAGLNMLANTPQMQAAQLGPAAQVGQGREIQAQQLGQGQQITADQLAGLNMDTVSQIASNPYLADQIAAVNRDIARSAAENQMPMNAMQALGAGGSGSTRRAVMDAITMRGAADRMGDVAAQMRSQAYGQGVGVASQQALANQAANLQAGGMNQQDALRRALANQATGLQAQGMNQRDALTRALSNQSALNQFGLQQGMFGQQANQLNQAAQLANQQLGFQGQLQADLANQSAALKAAMANQATGLQAQMANQQAALQQDQLRLGAGQLGAAIGAQGVSDMLAANNMGLGNLQAQLQGGLLDQALQQQIINADVEKWNFDQMAPYLSWEMFLGGLGLPPDTPFSINSDTGGGGMTSGGNAFSNALMGLGTAIGGGSIGL